MKPDAETITSIYQAWKAAVDEISDVQGLYPTFVLNEITASSLRVAATNGVGNVWGLEPEPLMSEFPFCHSLHSSQTNQRHSLAI